MQLNVEMVITGLVTCSTVLLNKENMKSMHTRKLKNRLIMLLPSDYPIDTCNDRYNITNYDSAIALPLPKNL
jgi:hypothetical protein